MTDFLTLTSEQRKSAHKPAAAATYTEEQNASGLIAAVARHADFEIASFHTPGHKGRALSHDFEQLQERYLRRDLTELSGLDDLSAPEGVILHMEQRASAVWQSAGTLLSVGGASAGIVAAMLALAAVDNRKKILVPRNVHRSVVNGLVLSGLFPIWYEPIWDQNWGVWGQVSPLSVDNALRAVDPRECCALLVVSPTYPGAVSDVRAIAQKCREAGLALVVDEAHGAHGLPQFSMTPSAAPYADVTVQSLHKTLSGFTQTGLVHVGRNSRLTPDQLRVAMNMIHSSSPSYPLLLSIEATINLLESEEGGRLVSRMTSLSEQLTESVQALNEFEIYRSSSGNDCTHILIRPRFASAETLGQFLQCERIFPEALLGSGVLLLLGIGSSLPDIEALIAVLKRFPSSIEPENWSQPQSPAPFTDLEQVFSPRDASLMPSEVVPIQEAIGRIASECVAPCPPGIPISIPGQRVHREVMNIASLRSLKVVKQFVSPTE